MLKNKGEKGKLKRSIVFIFLALVLVLSAAYVMISKYNNGLIEEVFEEPEQINEIDEEDDEEPKFKSYIEVKSNDVITQTFISDVDSIHGIGIKNYMPQMGYLVKAKICLYDNVSNELLIATEMKINDVYVGTFSLAEKGDIIPNVKNKELRMEIHFEALEIPTYIKTVENENYQVASVNGTSIEGSVDILLTGPGVSRVFIVTVIVLVLAIIACLSVFYLCYIKKSNKTIKIQNVYLIAGIAFGLAFLFLLPVGVVPDERAHLGHAYHISNTILGIENTEKGLQMRKDDADFDINRFYLTRGHYEDYYEDVFKKIENPQIVNSDIVDSAPGMDYLYIPSALGLSLGRILGLGTTATFIMGRVLNLIIFICSVFFAIKLIPFAKALPFVWALLPVSLQQAPSMSYDAIINSFCILSIALTLNLFVEDEKSYKKDGVSTFRAWLVRPKPIILIIISLLLIPCKHFALIPMALFPLMLVGKWISKNKDKIKQFRKNLKSTTKIIILAVMIMIVLAAIIVAISMIKTWIAPENINSQKLGWTNEYAYSIGYFLTNPVELVSIIVETIRYKSDEFFYQTFGAQLGHYSINIPIICIIPLPLLMVFAGMRKASEKFVFSIGNKIWLWTIFALVSFFALAGMLFAWTPMTYVYILGFQGRYFLPVLILPFLAIRTKKTTINENIDRNIALTAALCVFASLIFIIIPV